MSTTSSYHFTEPNYRGRWGPAWRYQLAKMQRSRSSPRAAGNDDAWVRDLANYLAIKARGADHRAQGRFPAIANAEVLNSNHELAAKTKLMVLADMATDEMHERLDVPVTTLEAWEAIYFDVRDLREATDWLAGFVIETERREGNTALSSRMKLAMSGGVLAVRLLLDSDAELPLDEANRLLQRKLKLHLKFDEVIDMPIDSEQGRLRFLSSCTQLHLETKRLELATRKVDEGCIRAREQHQLAKLRAELAIKRADQREAEWRHETNKRLQRQAAQQQRQAQAEDLCEDRQRAEQMALDARIATSPLAQCAWETVAATMPSDPTTESSPLQSKEPGPVEETVGGRNDPRRFAIPDVIEDFPDSGDHEAGCASHHAQLACVE